MNKSQGPILDVRSLFRSPPAEYAPTSFWFWNEPLDAEWLRWQVREQVDKGVRGFFIHARSGIPPEQYLAPIWWSTVEAVLEEARKVGARAWLYDELGWPSGSAGGRVPAKGPEYQQHFLQCLTAREKCPPKAELIKTFAVCGSAYEEVLSLIHI